MAGIVRSTEEWEAELGRRINLIRKQRGMTQEELAQRSNISRSAVKYLEAGKGSSLASFVKVARALELDEIFDQIFAVSSPISPLAILAAKRKLERK
ncbi:MAG: helix-turn-helix transcriptional regulator [Actinobacteria bacterium]|nr:helix-turn-helix transcriptional regulator [Actinomycetota bacterium]